MSFAGTYDIDFVDAAASLGTYKGVEAVSVMLRGSKLRRDQGEGVWHWDGMSDSEDEDWRGDSDSEDEGGDGDVDVAVAKRDRITFRQFDSLGDVLQVAADIAAVAAGGGGNRIKDGDATDVAVNVVDTCISLLDAVAVAYKEGNRGGGDDAELVAFTDVLSLAAAIRNVWSKKNNASETKEQGGDGESKTATAATAATGGGVGAEGRGERAVDKDAMVLLNLLYAPRRSRLHSLVRTLCRAEDISHICAWTPLNAPSVLDSATASDAAARSSQRPGAYVPARGCPPIALVELPRLKLGFAARPDHEGVLRLYSVDHADLFVANINHTSPVAPMLAGIPHSLVLSNVRGEMQVLVPVLPPQRPAYKSNPFTTWLVMGRSGSTSWIEQMSQRYYLYPVHVSMSFLLTKGMNSALYLMVLRLLHRDYNEVFRLADSVATDTSFGVEGKLIFDLFKSARNDWHPDAHACRLKISLAIVDSGHADQVWELTTEVRRAGWREERERKKEAMCTLILW